MKVTPDALLSAIGTVDEDIIEKTAPCSESERFAAEKEALPEQTAPERKPHRLMTGILTVAAAAACITAVTVLLPKLGKDTPPPAESTTAATTTQTEETTVTSETTQTTETTVETIKKPYYDTQPEMEIDFNGDAYVSYCDRDAVKVVIPKEYKGRPVTRINGYAFNECTKLEEIIIPDTVTAIWCDFEGTPWLKKRQKENPLVIVNNIVVNMDACRGKVVIPEGVTSIGYDNYLNSKITELTIPGTVKKIDEQQFACFTSLKKLTIDAGLEEIGDHAFTGCTNLTEVILSEGLKIIGEGAFSDYYWWNGPEPSDYCTKLKKISIPESVKEIGADAFEGTPWLEEQRMKNPLVVVNGILIDGWNCKGSVTIPDNVKTIGHAAFYDSIGNADTMNVYNTKLTSVIIPDSVTKICDYAFAGCVNLADIKLPAGLTEIGGDALFRTKWMEEQQKKSALVIINGVLIDGRIAKGKVVVPDGVTAVCDHAFFDNRDLEEIILPDSVTSIGEFAFIGCGIDNMQIRASAGSYAETFAKENGFKFETID